LLACCPPSAADVALEVDREFPVRFLHLQNRDFAFDDIPDFLRYITDARRSARFEVAASSSPADQVDGEKGRFELRQAREA
jgi:hypothetical protein